MKDFVLPSAERLAKALEEACRCTGTIAERFQAAEREAGALFVGGSEGVVGARFQKISASPPNQGDPEDPPPPEEPFDDKQAYALLYALVYQINPYIFLVYRETLGREPTVEELLDFWARLRSRTPEELMWELIFSNPLAAGLGIVSYGTILGLPILFQAIKEGLQGKNQSPEDYARTAEAFREWFQEEGIRVISEPADVMLSIRDWLSGEGSFWGVLLSVGPLSGPAIKRLLNRAPSENLQNALRRFENATDGLPRATLLDILQAHGSETALRNLADLRRIAGNDATHVFNSLRVDAILELISKPNLLDGLPVGASLADIQRHINRSVLSNIPELARVLPNLSDDALNRILKVLEESSGDFVPENLQRLTDALGNERAANILNNLREPAGEERLMALLTDRNCANKYVLPNANNADFFSETWEYNGFRRLYGADDAPDDVLPANRAGWANGKNVSELQAALARAEANGVDVSFRKPGAGEHLHHIVPAADPAAAAARKSLMDLGIHPNSAFNGVGIDAQVHAQLHGRYKRAYNEVLQEALRNISTTQGAQTFLDDLARFVDGLPTPNASQTADQLAGQIVEFIKQYK